MLRLGDARGRGLLSLAGRRLLERKQLLGAEGLVVDLRGRLDEVLEVGAGEEVAEVDKLAVVLVLDVDDAPAVEAPAHGLAVNDDVALAADNSEGEHVADTLVELELLGVELVAVEGVQADLVVLQLSHDALLEERTLLERERVRLGNDGHDVDNLRELLQDRDVDLESV